MDKRGAILMSEKERDAMVVLERVRAKGDDDGGSDAAVGEKLPAMLAAVEAI